MAWDKIVSQKDAVKSFLVTRDGKVDLEASVSKYRQAAQRHIAGQEAEEDLIGTCMTELFDQYPGAHLGLDYIKSQVVQRMINRESSLNEPGLFPMLSKRVEDFLHENCDQAATEAKGDKPAREAITGRIYSMRKGKNGGFCRNSDQTAK